MDVMETQFEPVIVAQVKARVHERLPDISLQSIDDEVTGLFHQYAGSKVRTYLPILVERDAIDHFRSRPASTVA
jgi:hypothetical protein